MYDVIVVGAGPAGSSAAKVASKAGLNVLILEKEHFPRYKPCGGAISEKAISILDFPLPEELCERSIDGIRVHYRDTTMRWHKGYRLSTLITRSEFDNFLLLKAQELGSNLVSQKVLGYSEKKDYVEVLTQAEEFKSKFLVIASGCQDKLQTKIQLPATKNQYGVSIVAEIKESDDKIMERSQGYLDFYFDTGNTGYGWIFPHAGYYSVGVGGLASQLKNLKMAMESFLLRTGFHGRYKLHGHRIPLGGIRSKIANRRVLLAGDSAGFVDSLTGEGIYYAIRSGQIAANAIVQQDPTNVSNIYEATCRNEFGEDLNYALWIRRSLDGHRINLMKILTSSEDYIDTYLEVAAGKKSYKDFILQFVAGVIQSYTCNNCRQIDKPSMNLKNFFGTERVNLRIISSDNNILRMGFVLENARISKVAPGGLNKPTIVITLTDNAASRIEQSSNTFKAIQREIKNHGLSINGQGISSQLKLNILLSSISLRSFLKIFLNTLNI